MLLSPSGRLTLGRLEKFIYPSSSSPGQMSAFATATGLTDSIGNGGKTEDVTEALWIGSHAPARSSGNELHPARAFAVRAFIELAARASRRAVALITRRRAGLTTVTVP